MNDQPTPEELRTRARDIVAAALVIPTGQASQEVAQLIDEEVAEICAADNVLERREVCKAVLGRSYDRRREADSSAAKKKLAAAGQAAQDPPPAAKEAVATSDEPTPDTPPAPARSPKKKKSGNQES